MIINGRGLKGETLAIFRLLSAAIRQVAVYLYSQSYKGRLPAADMQNPSSLLRA